MADISLRSFADAENNTLLIKRDGKWETITLEKLLFPIKSLNENFDEIKREFEVIKKDQNHFIKYAKSHFICAFNFYKVKILEGEFEANEDELKLGDQVLNGSISVEKALEKSSEELKSIFQKLYLSDLELENYQEV